MQKYETGANRISAGKLYYIANYLGLNFEDFFSENIMEANKKHNPDKSNQPKAGSGTDLHVKSRHSWKIAKNYENISNPKHRQAVAFLIKSLAE